MAHTNGIESFWAVLKRARVVGGFVPVVVSSTEGAEPAKLLPPGPLRSAAVVPDAGPRG